jgi:uncharacterized lipoprotein YbaY
VTRILPALLLLAGCSAQPPAPPPGPVDIVVTRQGDGCTARIEGRIHPAFPESAVLRAHMADLKARGRRARLVIDVDAPYRCIGEIIYRAQQIGLPIGFIAEPDPRAARR